MNETRAISTRLLRYRAHSLAQETREFNKTFFFLSSSDGLLRQPRLRLPAAPAPEPPTAAHPTQSAGGQTLREPGEPAESAAAVTAASSASLRRDRGSGCGRRSRFDGVRGDDARLRVDVLRLFRFPGQPGSAALLLHDAAGRGEPQPHVCGKGDVFRVLFGITFFKRQ